MGQSEADSDDAAKVSGAAQKAKKAESVAPDSSDDKSESDSTTCEPVDSVDSADTETTAATEDELLSAAGTDDTKDSNFELDDFLSGANPERRGTSKAKQVVVNVMFDRDIDDAAVADLTKAGFEVQEKFDVFPIVTGKIDSDAVETLSRIKGVTSVEENRDVGLL